MSISEASMQSECCKINLCETIKSPHKAHKSNVHCCDDCLFKSSPQTASIQQRMVKGTVGNSEGEINWHASRVTVHSLPITGLAKHDKHSLSSTFH